MPITIKEKLVGKITRKGKIQGQVAIKPVMPMMQRKTVNISQNGGIVIIPDEGYGGLEKVDVNTDVQPRLQNKSIEITTNTTTNISPDSGYDGLGNVSVTTNIPIPTIYPPDWSQIGYTSTPTDIIDSFNYSKDIYDNWDSTQTNLFNKFNGDRTLRYMPMVDTSNATDMRQYVLWM